jgi:hypothetical protein
MRGTAAPFYQFSHIYSLRYNTLQGLVNKVVVHEATNRRCIHRLQEVESFDRDSVLGVRGMEAGGREFSWQCLYNDQMTYCKRVVDASVDTGARNE